MNHMDFQFQVSLCSMDGDPHDQAFGGVEFGNTWKDALAYAEKWLKREASKNPNHQYKAVVMDRMNRKPTTEITL